MYQLAQADGRRLSEEAQLGLEATGGLDYKGGALAEWTSFLQVRS